MVPWTEYIWEPLSRVMSSCSIRMLWALNEVAVMGPQHHARHGIRTERVVNTIHTTKMRVSCLWLYVAEGQLLCRFILLQQVFHSFPCCSVFLFFFSPFQGTIWSSGDFSKYALEKLNPCPSPGFRGVSFDQNVHFPASPSSRVRPVGESPRLAWAGLHGAPGASLIV